MPAGSVAEDRQNLIVDRGPASQGRPGPSPTPQAWSGSMRQPDREAWWGRALGMAVFAAVLLLSGALLTRKHSSDLPITFMVIGDFGRRGAYNQTEVAQLLAAKAADMHPQFIISVGDNMYPSGLSSPDNAAFDASFVQPYQAKSLQVPWYAILGNHDYGDKCYDEPPGCYVYSGDSFYSPLHQLDATLVERDWRWNCQRSFELTLGGGLAELFFIDTNPAVQEYYERPWANFTGGLTSQDWGAQLSSLKRKLHASQAAWKIVIGHHPPRSNGHHGNTVELLDSLEPIMQEAGVQVYFAGHDHNLEYIHASNLILHYIISGGGSKSDRPFTGDTDSLFQWPYSGFVTAELSKDELTVHFYGFGTTSNDLEPMYSVRIPV